MALLECTAASLLETQQSAQLYTQSKAVIDDTYSLMVGWPVRQPSGKIPTHSQLTPAWRLRIATPSSLLKSLLLSMRPLTPQHLRMSRLRIVRGSRAEPLPSVSHINKSLQFHRVQGEARLVHAQDDVINRNMKLGLIHLGSPPVESDW